MGAFSVNRLLLTLMTFGTFAFVMISLNIDGLPSSLAQSQEQNRLVCGEATIDPNGNGDGDAADDDQKLHTKRYNNTIVELWCIDGRNRNEGFFFALLVDGVPGVPFRFVGKCAWPWGDNDLGVSAPQGDLAEIVWTSKDVSKLNDLGTPIYTGSNNEWRYTYRLSNPDLVEAKKINAAGTVVADLTVTPAPTRPFVYDSLHSDTDPEECTIDSVGGPTVLTAPVQPTGSARSSLAALALTICGLTAVVLAGWVWWRGTLRTL